ncbi:MAG: NAD(P)-dependent oxidoreductase [Victivallales bacterium]|jgi:nucleoside-diphosphate-sugar epimerase
MPKRKILITGVAGLIGRVTWNHLARYPGKYELYGMDRTLESSKQSELCLEKVHIPPERVTLADLTDYQKVLQAVTGMDTVVQLAALASPITPWKSVLSSNIDGLYNVFEACREAGVKRIIYASSIRVSQGYFERIKWHGFIRSKNSMNIMKNFKRVTHLDPPRATEPYGVAKLFGEDLARMYSDVHGLSCICIRFGAVNGFDFPFRDLGMWCSHKDVSKIIELCVEAPNSLKYDVFYAISKSKFQWVDSGHAREVLGFESAVCGNDRIPMLG